MPTEAIWYSENKLNHSNKHPFKSFEIPKIVTKVVAWFYSKRSRRTFATSSAHFSAWVWTQWEKERHSWSWGTSLWHKQGYLEATERYGVNSRTIAQQIKIFWRQVQDGTQKDWRTRDKVPAVSTVLTNYWWHEDTSWEEGSSAQSDGKWLWKEDRKFTGQSFRFRRALQTSSTEEIIIIEKDRRLSTISCIVNRWEVRTDSSIEWMLGYPTIFKAGLKFIREPCRWWWSSSRLPLAVRESNKISCNGPQFQSGSSKANHYASIASQ